MGDLFVAFSLAYKIVFVPGFISFLEFKDMCDVFDRVSTVYRAGIGGTYPSFYITRPVGSYWIPVLPPIFFSGYKPF